MDTPTDFLFLEESIATKYNPRFGDREYLVIQTYPLGKTTRVVYRTYDYQEAERSCNLENLSHDYSSYATRIYHDSKLWIPGNISGIPYKISEQQFWEIHPDYKVSDLDAKCATGILPGGHFRIKYRVASAGKSTKERTVT
ncbi:MAG: hypothetical protein ACYT04_36105, partial [Nostoc sp.]